MPFTRTLRTGRSRRSVFGCAAGYLPEQAGADVDSHYGTAVHPGGHKGETLLRTVGTFKIGFDRAAATAG